MKRCFDKLRGREKASEVMQGEEELGKIMVPQVGVGTYVSKGTDASEYNGLDKSTMTEKPQVAGRTYVDEGTDAGERDCLIESKVIEKRANGKRSRTMRKTPVKEQKIVCDVSYWGPTKSIEEADLAALLDRTVGKGTRSYFKLIDRLSGAFNVAYIMESPRGVKVCVRVPACGFPARWNRYVVPGVELT